MSLFCRDCNTQMALVYRFEPDGSKFMLYACPKCHKEIRKRPFEYDDLIKKSRNGKRHENNAAKHNNDNKGNSKKKNQVRKDGRKNTQRSRPKTD